MITDGKMIKLNRKTEYALIALTRLASQPEGRVSAKDLAREFHIPGDLLAKVLQQLQGAGLIKSTQGPHGGYAIACRPDEVRLTDLIRELEGPVAFVSCLNETPTGGGEACEQASACNIHPTLHAINSQIEALLSRYTLRDLLVPPAPLIPLGEITVRAQPRV